MGKKLFVLLCLCCLVMAAVTVVAAERQKESEKLAVEGPDNTPAVQVGPTTRSLDTPIQTKAPKSRVVGVIQYDDGVLTSVPAISSFCYGNQFSTASGAPVLASGSVTQIQFFMNSPAGTDNVFVSVYGPVAGATAPFLDDISVPLNNGPGSWNTATITAQNYVGASFLAGVWYIGGDTVGLGTGTTGAQGHHGMLINDVAGTGFSTLPGLNALVRAGGDVLVPVELMSFSVE